MNVKYFLTSVSVGGQTGLSMQCGVSAKILKKFVCSQIDAQSEETGTDVTVKKKTKRNHTRTTHAASDESHKGDQKDSPANSVPDATTEVEKSLDNLSNSNVGAHEDSSCTTAAESQSLTVECENREDEGRKGQNDKSRAVENKEDENIGDATLKENEFNKKIKTEKKTEETEGDDKATQEKVLHDENNVQVQSNLATRTEIKTENDGEKPAAAEDSARDQHACTEGPKEAVQVSLHEDRLSVSVSVFGASTLSRSYPLQSWTCWLEGPCLS